MVLTRSRAIIVIVPVLAFLQEQRSSLNVHDVVYVLHTYIISLNICLNMLDQTVNVYLLIFDHHSVES